MIDVGTSTRHPAVVNKHHSLREQPGQSVSKLLFPPPTLRPCLRRVLPAPEPGCQSESGTRRPRRFREPGRSRRGRVRTDGSLSAVLHIGD